MPGLSAERFAARRQAGWRELEEALGTIRGSSVRSLPAERLERLGLLYRRVAGDLALARRDFPGEAVTEYLNTLVARAHPVVYRGEPLRPEALGGFFATGIPRAFRRAGPYVLASLGISLVGVVAGWMAVELRPDLASSIAPQTSLFDRMARGEVPTGTDTGLAEALLIILNNVRVALVAFIGGLLLGVPTVLILLVNGWTLGSLGAVEHRDSLDLTFWSFIAPHGVVELSIFVFSGATGLMLADAVYRPGLLRRVDALAAMAWRTVGLAVGVACLLVTCGLLEGLLSPSGAPGGLKYAVGAVTGAGLYSWLLLAGRERPPPPRISLERTLALDGAAPPPG